MAACAQVPAMLVIGYLSPTSPGSISGRLRAFHQSLKETGYVVGENVEIEYRWADGKYDLFPTLAAELVRKQVSERHMTGIFGLAANRHSYGSGG